MSSPIEMEESHAESLEAEAAVSGQVDQVTSAPIARPLSIERRASMFNKLFKPSVERIFVPSVNEPCEHFEPRKGAFAALGRCAKCNFKEDEHGKAKRQPQLGSASPNQPGKVALRWTLGKKPKYSDEEEETPTTGNNPEQEKTEMSESTERKEKEAVVPPNQEVLEAAEKSAENLEESTTARRASMTTTVTDTSMVTAAAESTNESITSTEPLDNVPDVVVVVSDIEDEDYEDLDQEDVEDEEEEEVERPSWAPPPLIDVSTIDDSTAADKDDGSNDNALPPANGGEVSPSRRARAMSWLRSRSASSSASDNSSGSMGNKRASLKLLASQIKAKMSKAKDTWESKVGDLPKCNRCGRVIDPHHKVVSAGMERFHEICPTKEESEQGPRNCRYFVQKAQERVVVTFRCDKDTKQPYSFIFDIDPNTRQTNMRKPNTSEMVLVYIPDAKSHASLERKFRVPKTREFDISVRYSQNFGFMNPATNEACTPVLDLPNKKVTIVKHCTTNGVLHSIEARFVYDEENHVIKPDHLELRFSMMPGAIARLPTIIQTRRRNSAVMRRLEEKRATTTTVNDDTEKDRSEPVAAAN